MTDPESIDLPVTERVDALNVPDAIVLFTIDVLASIESAATVKFP